MQLGNQIKKYRNDLKLSQDELADKVFVTRQSISNWENNKTYPDINSLILLSEVFSISLDVLIKGDLEMIKNEVNMIDVKAFKKDSNIFTVLFVLVVLAPFFVCKFISVWSVIAYAALFAVAMYYAIKVEKHKKQHDIQTYKEILAYNEGKTLDEIEKARESGKRNYQKVLLAIASGVITLVIFYILIWLFG